MKQGLLYNRQGDVTKPQRLEEDEVVVIAHVCNNIGSYGAGVALAIAKAYPAAKEEYIGRMEGMKVAKVEPVVLLGESDAVWISDDLIVCNMIAQHELISQTNPRPLKYDALVDAMRNVVTIVDSKRCEVEKQRNVVIHCPMFGSDLAGGNWNFILKLIEDIWLNPRDGIDGIDVVVYEYKP
jgi:O-acetyl-ADP-ribose deacetylase (regulator of RNase III)